MICDIHEFIQNSSKTTSVMQTLALIVNAFDWNEDLKTFITNFDQHDVNAFTSADYAYPEAEKVTEKQKLCYQISGLKIIDVDHDDKEKFYLFETTIFYYLFVKYTMIGKSLKAKINYMDQLPRLILSLIKKISYHSEILRQLNLEDNDLYDVGCYKIRSLLKFRCYSTIEAVANGNKLIMYTTSPIKAGEQLFVSSTE